MRHGGGVELLRGLNGGSAAPKNHDSRAASVRYLKVKHDGRDLEMCSASLGCRGACQDSSGSISLPSEYLHDAHPI